MVSGEPVFISKMLPINPIKNMRNPFKTSLQDIRFKLIISPAFFSSAKVGLSKQQIKDKAVPPSKKANMN